MSQALMFINPKSGQLSGFTSPAEIKAKLADHGLAPELYLAKSWRGMARFIAKVRRQQPPLVIIAGGDGTIGTIIKGLIGRQLTFGLIPTGSINNLATTLGVPSNLDQALRVIQSGKTAEFDCGKAGGVPFLEAVGIGLIARIFDATDWDKDKRVGQMVAKTASELVGPGSINVTGQADGRPLNIDTVWLTIANNCRIGTLTLDPKSKIDDGWLDLVYCQPLKLRELPRYAAKFVKTTHLELDKFQALKVKRLQLRFDQPHRVHVDDRVVRRRQLTVEIIPKAVKVLVP